MGDAREHQKLLEPPTKHKKLSDRRRTYVIYSQCNKQGHYKECCHWNLHNPNNKLKDKKEVVNGISAQPGGIRIKFDNKEGYKKTNKSGSIITTASFAIPLNIEFMTTFIKT